MDIETEFPMRVFLNLGRRQDRRAQFQSRAQNAGIEVRRFPAYDARWLKKREAQSEQSTTGGFQSPARYAVSISKRLAIREAKQSGMRALLLMEDDAVFSPDFREAVAALTLPEDWGIFYFGCLHVTNPKRTDYDGIVKVTRAVDMHAIAIRAPYFQRVIHAASPRTHRTEESIRNSDVLISDLHCDIPTYAAWPNLVWQGQGESDTTGRNNNNYSPTGEQLWRTEHRHPM